MEDTKSLLMMVLHKVFQTQPKTIENIFQLIHSFNNGKIDKRFYEKTLKNICDLINDKLPSPILVYVLTLVDMPKNFDSPQSSLIEKMKQTHDCLPEINVRPHLLEYLNSSKPSLNLNVKNEEKTIVKKQRLNNFTGIVTVSTEPNFVKPVPKFSRRKRILSKRTESSKTLLDICANYVILHEDDIKVFYKNRQTTAWNLINSNTLKEKQLEQCYDVLKDLNKKMRWIREIYSKTFSPDFLMEEYKDSKVILEKNVDLKEIEKDPFVLSEEIENVISLLF